MGHGDAARGLIPAHAGKTHVTVKPLDLMRAHPRSRGENHAAIDWVARSEGSSPLTRGKPSVLVSSPMMCRLIPAHAGKTARTAIPRARRWAHPRSRGENITNKLKQLPGWGSSPLTRGKHEESRRGGPEAGLIPAHAGKTFQAELEMIQERAHPRSRGENGILVA